jgi:hypothetical protein
MITVPNGRQAMTATSAAPKQTTPQMQLVNMTPEWATQILEKNSLNRTIFEREVLKLARAMSRGEWHDAHPAPVVIDTEDNLIDGQHRLLAIAKAGGGPYRLWLYTGVSREVQVDIDTGRKRSLGDTLGMHPWNEVNAKQLGSALRKLWQIRQQRTPHDGHVEPTRQQLLGLLEEEPQIRDSLRKMAPVSSNLRVSQGGFAALHVLFSAVDPEDADVFMLRLADGVGLQHGNPIGTLRRRLLDEAVKPYRQVDQVVKEAWTIIAFNAWRAGRELLIVKWQRGGANPRPFPTIDGS